MSLGNSVIVDIRLYIEVKFSVCRILSVECFVSVVVVYHLHELAGFLLLLFFFGHLVGHRSFTQGHHHADEAPQDHRDPGIAGQGTGPAATPYELINAKANDRADDCAYQTSDDHAHNNII